jgi:hypothetical protein
MWNTETIIGIAAIPIGIGGGWMLEHSGYPVFGWLLASLLVIGGIIFLIYGLNQKHREKTLQNETKKADEPILKVYAKVNKILPFDYYAKAGGYSEFFNSRQFIINVTLSPSKPMKIDLIQILLCGKPYKAKEQINDYIKDSQSYKFTFDVPNEVAINTNDAQIKTWSNNQPYDSNAFEINFNESAK